jgi:hypothetical protein
VEISATDNPAVSNVTNSQVFVLIDYCPLYDINVELDRGICGFCHESIVAILKHPDEVETSRPDVDRQSTNRD